MEDQLTCARGLVNEVIAGHRPLDEGNVITLNGEVK